MSNIDATHYNLKLVLIIFVPFVVGWLIIAHGIPQDFITQDQRVVVLLFFTVAWLVCATCYGLYQEKQAKKMAESMGGPT